MHNSPSDAVRGRFGIEEFVDECRNIRRPELGRPSAPFGSPGIIQDRIICTVFGDRDYLNSGTGLTKHKKPDREAVILMWDKDRKK